MAEGQPNGARQFVLSGEGARPPEAETGAALGALLLKAGEGFLRSEERDFKAEDRLAACQSRDYLADKGKVCQLSLKGRVSTLNGCSFIKQIKM